MNKRQKKKQAMRRMSEAYDNARLVFGSKGIFFAEIKDFRGNMHTVYGATTHITKSTEGFANALETGFTGNFEVDISGLMVVPSYEI